MNGRRYTRRMQTHSPTFKAPSPAPAREAAGLPPLALPRAAIAADPPPPSKRDRQLLASLHHTDFLNPGADREDAGDAHEDQPVRVRLGPQQAADTHVALHIASLQAARRLGPVTGIRVSGMDTGLDGLTVSTPLVVIEMQPAARPARLCTRTATHLVSPWHRVERPKGHGRAGNVLLGLGLAGLVTGLTCSRAWACEDDANIASSAASLGALAAVIGTGALECGGLRPLERPMLRLHLGLRQLWTLLRRPPVTEQLRAIVDEARESRLTPDGLEAVLDRCAELLAGHTPAQVLASGWGSVVLDLIPGATGAYSGPMPDRVRNFVAGFTGE